MCGDEELLNNLLEANQLLDQVQKGLNDYLETKRQAFPRYEMSHHKHIRYSGAG